MNRGIGKDVFLMSFGTVIAQLINVLIQPILTRLVDPNVLGIYTYVVSLGTMIVPIASLKLDMLVVSEKNDDEAQFVTDTCIILCIMLSVIYLVLISIFYFFPSENVFNRYGLIIYLVPIVLLTNGLRFLFISYNNRYKQYKLISIIGIIREGARGIIQTLSGLLNFGVLGQVLGYAIAPFFGVKYQTLRYFSALKKRSFVSFSKFKDIVFVKGKKQIMFLVPAQFVNNVSNSIIVVSISELYLASTLGYYSVGVRLLDVPLIFITANISKVCYRQISELVSDSKPIFPTIKKIALYLLFSSIVGFSLLYFLAPTICRIFFGNGYEIAGEYIKCMCLMYSMRFVATSFSGLFTIFNKQNIEFYLNLGFLLISLLVLILCKYYIIPISGYLWMISSSYFLIYLFLFILYLRTCWVYEKNVTNCKSN